MSAEIPRQSVPIIGKSDKPVVRNWVYRHIRENETEVALSDEAKAAHTTERGETPDKTKIVIPACLICQNPMIPVIRLADDEQGIIEICPGLPMFHQQFKAMSEMLEKKIPQNAPCPCGSGLKFKRCHGKTTDD